MLSPLNLREDRSPEQLAADGDMGDVSLDAPVTVRSLPTAEELGDVYSRHQLDHLIYIALRTNDRDALALLEAAIASQEKAELLRALNPETVKEMRARRGQSHALKLQLAMGNQADLGQVAWASKDTLAAMGQRIGGSASEQSFGPSE